MRNENFNELRFAARKQGEIFARGGRKIGQALIDLGKAIVTKDEEK